MRLERPFSLFVFFFFYCHTFPHRKNTGPSQSQSSTHGCGTPHAAVPSFQCIRSGASPQGHLLARTGVVFSRECSSIHPPPPLLHPQTNKQSEQRKKKDENKEVEGESVPRCRLSGACGEDRGGRVEPRCVRACVTSHRRRVHIHPPSRMSHLQLRDFTPSVLIFWEVPTFFLAPPSSYENAQPTQISSIPSSALHR